MRMLNTVATTPPPDAEKPTIQEAQFISIHLQQQIQHMNGWMRVSGQSLKSHKALFESMSFNQNMEIKMLYTIANLVAHTS